jgi:signal peptidase I
MYYKERWTENFFADRILKWIVDLLVVVVMAFLAIWFFGKDITVDGNSMTETLENEQVVLLNRLAYELNSPQTGDIIAYQQEGDTQISLKRIVAEPGDTVEIKEGVLYVNDTPSSYNTDRDLIVYSGIAGNKFTVEDGSYFVMGDNWNNSEDSRYKEIGTIKQEDILGKVWLRVAPFAKIGLVK